MAWLCILLLNQELKNKLLGDKIMSKKYLSNKLNLTHIIMIISVIISLFIFYYLDVGSLNYGSLIIVSVSIMSSYFSLKNKINNNKDTINLNKRMNYLIIWDISLPFILLLINYIIS